MSSGDSESATTGSLSITTGSGKIAGVLAVSQGDSAEGSGGPGVVVQSGNVMLGDAASVEVLAGSSAAGLGGAIRVEAGRGFSKGGNAEFSAGEGVTGGTARVSGGTGSQAGGQVVVASGVSTDAEGASGAVYVQSASGGYSGDVTVSTGDSTLDSGGVNIRTGASSGAAGDVVLVAGYSGTSAPRDGGNVVLEAGGSSAAGTSAGSISMSAG